MVDRILRSVATRVSASGRARESGLVALVALGFAVGLSAVGWATAPLVPADSPRISRASTLATAPPDPAVAAIRPEGPARDENVPAVGDSAEPSGDVAAFSSDSLARILADLRGRHLTLPVEGIERGDLRESFDDPRSGGRRHRAIDILAPRGAPVFAVEDGTIARMDDSQPGGGIVVYQYDPSRTYAYYYAHLEGWAEGLEEGDRVGRGQVIGYVGTTGNAPPGTPHLHFAITLLGPDGRWWSGTPINPYGLF